MKHHAEKYRLSPAQKVAGLAIVAAAIAIIAASSSLRVTSDHPSPEKSVAETDICEGLSPVRCMEERTYEKRRIELARARAEQQ